MERIHIASQAYACSFSPMWYWSLIVLSAAMERFAVLAARPRLQLFQCNCMYIGTARQVAGHCGVALFGQGCWCAAIRCH